jgi:rRNA maturation endonuclease Nob1
VSVYVDGMRAPLGRMVMCHMIADTSEELLLMADRIGVDRKWLQDAGTDREHFDIALSKRRLAIQHGAIEIGMRDLAVKIRAKREKAKMNRFDCANCGQGIGVDEDGCCRTCGADGTVVLAGHTNERQSTEGA